MRPLNSFLKSTTAFSHTLHSYDAVVEEWIGDYESMEDYPVEEKLTQLIRQRPFRALQGLLIYYALFMFALSKVARSSQVKALVGSWVGKNGLLVTALIGLIDVVSLFAAYGNENEAADTIPPSEKDDEKVMFAKSLIEGMRHVIRAWPSPHIVFSLLALLTCDANYQIFALTPILLSYHSHILCAILLTCALIFPNITRMVGLYLGLLKSVTPRLPSDSIYLSNDNKSTKNKKNNSKKSKQKNHTVPLTPKITELKSPSLTSVEREGDDNNHAHPHSTVKDSTNERDLTPKTVFRYHYFLQRIHEMKILHCLLFLLELQVILPQFSLILQELSLGIGSQTLGALKGFLFVNYVVFKIGSIISQ